MTYINKMYNNILNLLKFLQVLSFFLNYLIKLTDNLVFYNQFSNCYKNIQMFIFFIQVSNKISQN